MTLKFNLALPLREQAGEFHLAKRERELAALSRAGLSRRSQCVGFIPACAGNTGFHGRMKLSQSGSSPRVRGTLISQIVRPLLSRFIPACAGNTPYRATASISTSVHPRVCGEHHHGIVHGDRPNGSSPRVRGTHLHPFLLAADHRFIPACAGNTAGYSAVLAPASVHPRVCGEHVRIFHDPARVIGSSPRVRGTLDRQTALRCDQRFIPACAGNTTSTQAALFSKSVHPRVCGKHGARMGAVLVDGGSSPRVRGTHAQRAFPIVP